MARRIYAGCLSFVALAAVSVIFLLLTWGWCLDQIGDYLVLDQPPEPSDAIVAISGEQSRRAWAIELYRRGHSNLLIFNVSDTTYFFGQAIDPVESVRQMTLEAGIPAKSLVINTQVKSTWEDALATRESVLRLGLKSIIVVSSPFNMRRVWLTYNHVLEGVPVNLRFCAVPWEIERLSPQEWWKNERELQLVVNEYLKISFYYFKYFL
jgi:uncharacterized SAM-binding protein YcdF (DUF218 family)